MDREILIKSFVCELNELENNNYPGLAGYPCSIKSKQSANGIGCAWYAMHDVCPDDDTKGYWESLPN